MKEEPASPIFIVYFIIWAILAIGSWLHIRSRLTPQEKKKWFDRWCIIGGIFVTFSLCLILAMWKQYIGIPVILTAGAGITLMNLRGTYYCESCGKRSLSQSWFSSSFHCPIADTSSSKSKFEAD